MWTRLSHCLLVLLSNVACRSDTRPLLVFQWVRYFEVPVENIFKYRLLNSLRNLSISLPNNLKCQHVDLLFWE